MIIFNTLDLCAALMNNSKHHIEALDEKFELFTDATDGSLWFTTTGTHHRSGLHQNALLESRDFGTSTEHSIS